MPEHPTWSPSPPTNTFANGLEAGNDITILIGRDAT
jgi:hypothetical protein